MNTRASILALLIATSACGCSAANTRTPEPTPNHALDRAGKPGVAETPRPVSSDKAPASSSAQTPSAPLERLPAKDELVALAVNTGPGSLVALLGHLPKAPEQAFTLQTRVFDVLEQLNDPDSIEPLVAFLGRQQHVHFQTRAALELGALGDLRAVPFLARRLRLDPFEIYDDSPWEIALKRDDGERVSSMRVLADLAAVHPEARASIRAEAEASIEVWMQANPLPHAYALRALAELGSMHAIADLRNWSNPTLPLPKEGEQPPMSAEWLVAQMALRYVGKLQDPPSFDVLLQALQRRPKGIDVSTASLQSGTWTMLGMTLRALADGAADGLSEWGDRRALAPLSSYVAEPFENEESRMRAGAALAWVASDADLVELAKRLARTKYTPQTELQILCTLAGLKAKPVTGVAPALMTLLRTKQSPAVRLAAAMAIGSNALDPKTEAQLVGLSKKPESRTEATLALLLGGTAERAKQAFERFAASTKSGGADSSLSDLMDAWSHAHDFVSTDDVSNGKLLRRVRNADAASAVRIAGQPQYWLRERLGAQLQEQRFDNGPHSVTRVVLNAQLWAVAHGPDLESAKLALRAYALLNERGHLLALARGTGALAEAAATEYQALMPTEAVAR